MNSRIGVPLIYCAVLLTVVAVLIARGRVFEPEKTSLAGSHQPSEIGSSPGLNRDIEVPVDLKSARAAALSGNSLNPFQTASNQGQADAADLPTATITSIVPSTRVKNVVKVGGGVPASLLTRTDDFRFPSISNDGSGPTMHIPDGDLPARSARRSLEQGDGRIVGYGDTVALHYDVYSWSSGALIMSSTQGRKSVVITIGSNSLLPPYVEQALIGRVVGSELQIVLGADGEDLVGTLNPQDAYVYLVRLDEAR